MTSPSSPRPSTSPALPKLEMPQPKHPFFENTTIGKILDWCLSFFTNRFDVSGSKKFEAKNWYSIAQNAAQQEQWERAYDCCEKALAFLPKGKYAEIRTTISTAEQKIYQEHLKQGVTQKTLDNLLIRAIAAAHMAQTSSDPSKHDAEASQACTEFFAQLRQEMLPRDRFGPQSWSEFLESHRLLREHEKDLPLLFIYLPGVAKEQGFLRMYCFYHGIGVESDRNYAVYEWERVGTGGEAILEELASPKKGPLIPSEIEALRDLGMHYWSIGDTEKAKKYLFQAAQAGNADAQYAMGRLLQPSHDSTRIPSIDPEKASFSLQWYIKAAKQNHVPALRALAYEPMKSLLQPKEWEHYCLQLAEVDPEVYALLARHFLEDDLLRAEKYYEQYWQNSENAKNVPLSPYNGIPQLRNIESWQWTLAQELEKNGSLDLAFKWYQRVHQHVSEEGVEQALQKLQNCLSKRHPKEYQEFLNQGLKAQQAKDELCWKHYPYVWADIRWLLTIGVREHDAGNIFTAKKWLTRVVECQVAKAPPKTIEAFKIAAQKLLSQL